ncbi:hypothetical protein C0W87_19320 [Photobacterium angustum]|nr:hypothetical protein C0W87_19320 [Photobacterium angustum]
MEVISHNQANYCPVYLACILTLEIVNAEERLKITMKNTPYNSQHIPPQAPGNQQGFWSQMARTGRHFPFTRNNYHVPIKELVSRKSSERQIFECKQGQ